MFSATETFYCSEDYLLSVDFKITSGGAKLASTCPCFCMRHNNVQHIKSAQPIIFPRPHSVPLLSLPEIGKSRGRRKTKLFVFCLEHPPLPFPYPTPTQARQRRESHKPTPPPAAAILRLSPLGCVHSPSSSVPEALQTP